MTKVFLKHINSSRCFCHSVISTDAFDIHTKSQEKEDFHHPLRLDRVGPIQLLSYFKLKHNTVDRVKIIFINLQRIKN